jgi:hypothetical protein
MLRDLDVVRHWSAEAEQERYETGARRWRVHAELSLAHARMRAERGDVTGAAGQAAKAVLEAAHARACRERLWVLNEKMLVERTGLAALRERFTRIPAGPASLVEWVGGLRRTLDAA